MTIINTDSATDALSNSDSAMKSITATASSLWVKAQAKWEFIASKPITQGTYTLISTRRIEEVAVGLLYATLAWLTVHIVIVIAPVLFMLFWVFVWGSLAVSTSMIGTYAYRAARATVLPIVSKTLPEQSA